MCVAVCLEPLQSDAPSPLSTNEVSPEVRARQAWSRLSTSLRAAALDPEASLRLRAVIAAEQDALDHALRALGAAHLGALLRAAQPHELPVPVVVREAVVEPVVEAVAEPVGEAVVEAVAEPVVKAVPAAEPVVEAVRVPVSPALCAALSARLNGAGAQSCRFSHPVGPRSVKTPAPRSVDDLLRCLREHLAQGRRAEALACLRFLVERGVSAKEPRLLGALRGHADLLDGQAGEGPWKALRKALHREQAEAARDREAPAEADDEQPLPADWPLRGQTQGMRVILVGGDPRPYARDALQAAFGFASVAWPAIPDKAPRAVTSAVAQIKSGRFDLVLFLKRFAGHDVFDRCRATAESVRFVVCRGYGIGAVRVALERDLAHVA